MAVRINRYLSQAGLGSRRKVEAFIRAGRVRVNGTVCTRLGTRIDPGRDQVEVDGEQIHLQSRGRLLLFHKPAGVICSFRRQGTSPCLVDYFAPGEGRLFHVGRLDRDTSGLLLLSDDGDLAHRLLHPSHPVWKTYRVVLDAPLDEAALARFAQGGLVLDGRPCAPAFIRARADTRSTTYEVRLREGRKRQIRRMFQILDRRVVDLHREAFGPLSLGALEPGETRPATVQEADALRRVAWPSQDDTVSRSSVDAPNSAD